MRRRIAVLAAALAAAALALATVAAQEDFSFMPKGGKALLVELLGSPPDGGEMRDILTVRRSEAEWRVALGDRIKALDERERETLAAYLAINMPVDDPERVIAMAGQPAELYAALPRDGRELGYYECMYCHSLFTSHLTQDRSFQAWMNMFESPFHREMKMTRQEREEFSRYSEINMPMRIEDVPPDLRF